ncbi:uncharacterized protein TNCV_2472781 [Trichonephila clavipes]|nr:uncharacterized protein TNCV_2472781 [Trichonephila clavipes]
MDWPAYSPDMNPIEDVWDMLGRRIAARQPPSTCLPELQRALLDEWCSIPQDQIDNLILSMPRRSHVDNQGEGQPHIDAQRDLIYMTPRLEPQVQDYVEVRIPQNTVQLLEVLSKFEERYLCKAMRVRGIVIMWKDEVGLSVGCLMLMIVEEIGEIRKLGVDRVITEMIIGVTTRMAVKEISGSIAGIDLKRMIEDLTIVDTNLEMGVKKTILVERTAEIEARVGILAEAIGGKGDEFIFLKLVMFKVIRLSRQMRYRLNFRQYACL